MAKDLKSHDLRRLARVGAEARLQEIRGELAAIMRAFPDLGRGAGAVTGKLAGGGRGGPSGKGARGRRRPMSAAERRSVSLRMKKYWAQRRKAKQAAG